MSTYAPAARTTDDARFTWVPLYCELADRLVEWESKQEELIALLERLRSDGYKVTPLMDKDKEGSRFLLKEIDPFTFFGSFNRGVSDEQRQGILKGIRRHLGATSDLPTDFFGVPVLNNRSSWLISYQARREPDAVERLWRVFRLALGEAPLENAEFLAAFDDALSIRQVNVNLTMGLFWIRPETFLNLDQVNRKYLEIKLPPSGLTSEFYRKTVLDVVKQGKPLVQVSGDAWLAAQTKQPTPPATASYWLVGAYWSDQDPPDQTDRFLADGIWQNGYEDRYQDEVRSMQVGDRIAIKAATTQKNNLPFDARGNTVSKMTIKAVGTIVANRGDGRTVEVEWESPFTPRDWYFYTDRSTIWRPRPENEMAQMLIAFVFEGGQQDYDWFCRKWWGTEQTTETQQQAYSIDDIVASGAFLEEHALRQAIDRLLSKKNLILQGAPGVGKTYLARRLAYALMEEKASDRIEMVQFHQSYSYEDFLRGYRPLPESGGGFGLQDGVFYTFCQRAKGDSDRPYVFIIDEINRGNLSQIFGEVLMLIESDKRGEDYGVQLVYRHDGERRFYIPNNLYLIGLMNLADRSLALVDYALRRRFAFMTLRAQYASPQFRKWLGERDMQQALIDLIVDRMTWLNEEIKSDPLLGANYEVGHSFFCPKGESFGGLDRDWYDGVIETEIVPLLREYWFDNPKRVDEIRQQLLAP